MEESQPVVATARVDGTGLYYLGHLGGVEQLSWTDTMPGGPAALSCQLDADPRVRHEAISPGRRVYVYKGCSTVWEGRMLEPAPGDAGWAITADGMGVLGNYYRADWVTWTAGSIIARAQNRGLRWLAGNLSGGYLAQPQDSATVTVTDALNQMTQTQSTTWRVSRVQAGWRADLLPVPSVPTRLLVTSVPQARTLAGYVNALYVKYQAAADKGNTPAKYAVLTPVLPDSIARHDRLEAFWDLTSSGVLPAATATSLGQQALSKYQAASYATAITASPGQYLTMGGVPVDLATEHAGEVAQLVLADGPYGGEIYPLPPVRFPVGQVKYDAGTGTLEITPYQSWKNDISNVMTILAPAAPA
jgi:hypothetical protein